jgi:hypothetical protein
MLLRCRRMDCHRRVEIDFRQAVHSGMGDQSTKHLIQLLRCGHWVGCQLEEVSASYPNGVPLVSYLNHKDVLIAVACEQCAVRILLPPRAIIARLMKAGTGDGSTGALELGGRVRGPCRQCGGRRFRTDVVWPKAPGTGR